MIVNASRTRRARAARLAGGLLSLLIPLATAQGQPDAYAAFGYNDLGMHCMQSDFSQMMVLPPFNTLHAQVIRRGIEPEIMTADVTVRFTLPGNTRSSDKCNFWTHAEALLGVTLPPDVGLGGFGMSGTMTLDPVREDYVATGIPVTPIDDDGKENPYPLALITVSRDGAIVTQTQAVVPVSWEMSCFLCHITPGISTATDILQDHDRLHATTLEAEQPVFCAACHADPAVGSPGQPGISNLSAAMHGAHALRMSAISLEVDCYACHPGVRTQCQRDIHYSAGMTCHSCHGGMSAMGDPTRRPWQDEPRCSTCHAKPGFEFEQFDTLYRNSVGHKGVQCMSCHGSPHAITPTITGADNLQAIRLQGHAGKIDTCIVCHTSTPADPFFHKIDN